MTEEGGKHTRPNEIVFDDTIWYDGDYALDAEGKPWKLVRHEFRDHVSWSWYEFGSEEDDGLEPWLEGEWVSFGTLQPYTGGPKKPVRKAVFIPTAFKEVPE